MRTMECLRNGKPVVENHVVKKAVGTVMMMRIHHQIPPKANPNVRKKCHRRHRHRRRLLPSSRKRMMTMKGMKWMQIPIMICNNVTTNERIMRLDKFSVSKSQVNSTFLTPYPHYRNHSPLKELS